MMLQYDSKYSYSSKKLIFYIYIYICTITCNMAQEAVILILRSMFKKETRRSEVRQHRKGWRQQHRWNFFISTQLDLETMFKPAGQVKYAKICNVEPL